MGRFGPVNNLTKGRGETERGNTVFPAGKSPFPDTFGRIVGKPPVLAWGHEPEIGARGADWRRHYANPVFCAGLARLCREGPFVIPNVKQDAAHTVRGRGRRSS